jgi:cytochrome c oxidase subunit 2
MSASSSPGEDYINKLFFFFLVLCGAILIIVFGMILTGVIRYRSGKLSGEPDQKTGNRIVEVLWTIIPFVLVTLFFFLTIKYMKAIDQPVDKNKQADIKIIAHQWWWEMIYPDLNFSTANELHIPAGRDLLMQIESADVIHDWWVPELGRKIDAIPGRTNYTWIKSNKPGEFRGACSEYCGTQHAHMLILVVAQDTVSFNSWVVSQQRVPALPEDIDSKLGLELFNGKACSKCHTIAGIASGAHLGPDLTHVSLRKTILSGMLPNSSQNLTRWLDNPQEIKEGSNMPDFMLSANEIKALVTFLEELK